MTQVPDSDRPHVVLVRLKTKDGQADEFKRELQELLPRIRQESACIEIVGHQDPEDPTRFMLFERWRSEATFTEFESGRGYLQDYLARVGDLWAEPRDLSVWEPVA
jgi:quinol monooxygenase YgiN